MSYTRILGTIALSLLFSPLRAAGATPSAAEASQAVAPAVTAVLAEVEANMVPIAAGTFQMGDLSGRGLPDEKPVHRVNVAAFHLSKYEITFAQYDVYAKATGKTAANDQGVGRGKSPVMNLNWTEANEFIAWLNNETGKKYRLPSEAEWEYAARAGSTTDYPWGNTFDASKANGSGEDGKDTWKYTAPVGSFPPNAFGLYDMIGNVWEWVQDCYSDTYEDAPDTAEAQTEVFGPCNPVIRGGSWANNPANLRVSDRSWHAANYRYYFLGFRLARDE